MLLQGNGVWMMPDFIVNAGGVIGSYVEYQGRTEKDAFELIQYKTTKNLKIILGEAIQSSRSPRAVAEEIARSRVKRAMLLRKGALEVARESYTRESQYEYALFGSDTE
jgi:glutamate dehydrogenase (NAD(P)+)